MPMCHSRQCAIHGRVNKPCWVKGAVTDAHAPQEQFPERPDWSSSIGLLLWTCWWLYGTGLMGPASGDQLWRFGFKCCSYPTTLPQLYNTPECVCVYIYIYTHTYIYIYKERESKTYLYTVNLFKWSIPRLGRLSIVDYCYNGIVWTIIWTPHKAIDIGEWAICGGGCLERFHCIYIYRL